LKKSSGKVLNLLKTNKNESTALLLLLLFSFLKGMSIVLFEITANTLYLKNFDVSTIPYIYVGVAVVTSVFGIIYGRIEKKVPVRKLLVFIYLFLFLSVTLTYVVLNLFFSVYFFIFLMVWKSVIWIILNIIFWAIAGTVFDVRQGKKFFGLIISGDILSGILSGLSTSFLAERIGTVNLMLLVLAAMLLNLAVLMSILVSFKDKFKIEKETFLMKEKSGSFLNLFKDGYLVLFFAVTILTSLGFYFIDFLFLNQTKTVLVNENHLAVFFGYFYAVSGIVNLIGTLFFSGRLLTRFGVGFGILSLPVMLLVACAGTYLFGYYFGFGQIVFISVVLTKLLDDVFRNSFETPSFRILYQPIPKDLRMKTQAFREAFIEPIAIGFSGIVLIILRMAFQKMDYFYFILSGILVFWIITGMLLRGKYGDILIKLISRRKTDTEITLAKDDSTLIILKEGLKSEYEGETLYSLSMLETLYSEKLSLDLKRLTKNRKKNNQIETRKVAKSLYYSELIRLIDHESPEIRIAIFGKMKKLNNRTFIDAILKRLKVEKNNTVKGEGILALCSIGGDEIDDEVMPYLKSTNTEIRKMTLSGLFLYYSGKDYSKILKMIDDLFASTSYKERILGAGIIGVTGSDVFIDDLIALLQDKNLQVRLEALNAACKVTDKRAVPFVYENIRDTRTIHAASKALIGYGRHAAVFLIERFKDDKISFEMKVKIIQIMKKIDSEKVGKFLFDNIGYGNFNMRYRILQALEYCKYRPENNKESKMIIEAIGKESENALMKHSIILDIQNDETTEILVLSLKNEIRKCRENILSLLSLIYPWELVRRIKINFFSGNPEKRTYSIEILENLIHKNLKKTVMPVIDEMKNKNVREDGEKAILMIKELLVMPLDRITRWTKVAALYWIGKKRVKGFENEIISSLSNSFWMVRETAFWALSRTDKKLIGEYSDVSIINPEISGKKKNIKKNGGLMLLTVEKVMILRSISIFSDTSDENLATIASLLEEVEVKKNEVIIKKGEIGTSMYIIISGKVLVYDERKKLKTLGEREVFGELASLSPENRLASVKAVEDAVLFRLEGESLYDLMSENIEVVHGVIQYLCQELRKSLISMNTNSGK
jgi:ATP:ADP antiporter, AAA family